MKKQCACIKNASAGSLTEKPFSYYRLGVTGLDSGGEDLVACGGCREASLNPWQNTNADNKVINFEKIGEKVTSPSMNLGVLALAA